MVLRTVRLARYGRLALSSPALIRGFPVAVGPRTSFRFAGGGTFARGQHFSIASDVEIIVRGHFGVGNDVFINRWCYISVFSSVLIGDRSRLGERVSIHDENHVYEPISRHASVSAPEKYVTKPVRIGSDVWIGANTVITAGSVIGDHTVVGANSVVRGVLPEGVLAAGVPARVIRVLAHLEGE